MILARLRRALAVRLVFGGLSFAPGGPRWQEGDLADFFESRKRSAFSPVFVLHRRCCTALFAARLQPPVEVQVKPGCCHEVPSLWIKKEPGARPGSSSRELSVDIRKEVINLAGEWPDR